ncbi:MAG: glutathione S-transferase N-terminal domain-containing protein [Alphaproteobacteria bacterium]|nr:glutathione S-transferase N-terminal domain-containing protein [Alphaproteobacteria bacterium]
MIDLYTAPTPNGRKASIMLEEVGLAYTVHRIDIGADEQFEPAFLEISPNNKIPAIVDSEGPGGEPVSVFESGAILIYLAEKTGRLMPCDARQRLSVLQWLMFQMGGVGPMFGQANHFIKFASEDVPYGKTRYRNEVMRLLGVMERRLSTVPCLAGAYSIADVATWPWGMRTEWYDTDWSRFPHVRRWYDTIGERDAVRRGAAIPS